MRKLFLLAFLLVGCTFISSFDSTEVTPLTISTTRVTTRVAGNLTVASTEVITDLAGKDLGSCKIVDTFKGVNHGVICLAVKIGFIVDVETLGIVTGRVTP